MFNGYKLVGEIGEGTYGTVHKACKVRDLTQAPWCEAVGPPYYAIKRLKSTPEQDAKNPPASSLSTLREVKLLRELRHINIVPLFDVVLDLEKRELSLVFEFAEWDMDRIIDHHKKDVHEPLHEFTLKSLMWQSMQGLLYLHTNWVMHRDLKPQNILVVGEGPRRGRVMLADMGLARIFRDPPKDLGKIDKAVVTLWYRAPELLLGELNYTPAIDVWSMGCVFADLLLAQTPSRALFLGCEQSKETALLTKVGIPFESDQCDKIFKIQGLPKRPQAESYPDFEHIKNWYVEKNYPRSSNLRAAVLPRVSDACYDLISKMLELDPSQRINAQDVLKHEYFLQTPLPSSENAVDVLDPTTGAVVDRIRYPVKPPKPINDVVLRLQEKEMKERAAEVEARFLGGLAQTSAESGDTGSSNATHKRVRVE